LVCKLCDFGLARFNTSTNRETLQTLRGTYEYVAPEVLGKSSYTAASDIYSFAIVLYEIMLCVVKGEYCPPYGHMKLPSVAILVRVMRGARPPMPAECPEHIKQVITQCWDGEPANRPNATEIIAALKQIRVPEGNGEPAVDDTTNASSASSSSSSSSSSSN
jgi:serine/threonine protein kinase